MNSQVVLKVFSIVEWAVYLADAAAVGQNDDVQFPELLGAHPWVHALILP